MSYIDNPLTEYAEQHTSGESEVLQELRKECYEHYEDSAMLSGFYQGRVLAMLSKMIQPRVVLEIGTYLGYSALCFAEGLADGGKVITLDVQEETNRVARSFVDRTQYAGHIEFHLGPATEIIPKLDETFDLVFDKVRPGGFIIADNVLWSGQVLEALKDENTQALHDYNQKVLADERVD